MVSEGRYIIVKIDIYSVKLVVYHKSVCAGRQSANAHRTFLNQCTSVIPKPLHRHSVDTPNTKPDHTIPVTSILVLCDTSVTTF